MNFCDYEQLLIQYRPLIFKIARGFFLKHGGDTEDLIQEGYIALWQAFKSFDSKKNENFTAYASTCVRNRIIGAVRLANTSAPTATITGEEPEASMPDPLRALEVQEETESLLQTLKNNLSKNQFEAIRFYLEGFSYKEISEKMGISTKSVDNLITVSKKKLREVIK
ncbi:MAG: sigma-70 family RNA polymerase sigma factor [Firmicutes bacterium]|nr:sigma-70 family RNA polymerase sigma factor [Bacillota bacterium]